MYLLQEKRIMLVISIIIGLLTAVSSCPDCCIGTIYIRLADTSDAYNECQSCNITVNELIQYQYLVQQRYQYHHGACYLKDYLFQSGIHHAR